MSDTETIKEKIDIVDFIKSRIQLNPAGRNFKGLCPFHKEKTPSLVVSPDRQIFHCFGCGIGGDVIKFLMQYENIEFFEALKILAEKAGVELKRSGIDQKQFTVLYDINQATKDAFHSYLMQDKGPAKQALSYLKERGLSEEIIKEFELGLAPESRDAQSRKLTRAGFNISDIERAGLIYKTERGTYWDRFRNRIIFPLTNSFGKVVGFSGRLVPWSKIENVGKYINSPETPIFNKSKLLFGLDKSKEGIRESKTAVLVEGQMDFLLMWADGIRNVVATSGTALTQEHLKNLKRFAENLVLIFDIDEAGQLAAERSIDLAEANDFNVKVFDYLELTKQSIKAKDPADIVVAEPGLIKKLIDQAKPAMEFYFQRYPIDEEDIGVQKKNIRKVLRKIKYIASPVVRARWVKELARRGGISEVVLTEEMESLSVPKPKEKDEQHHPDIPFRPQSRKEAIAQRLVSLSYQHESLSKSLKAYESDLPEDLGIVLSYINHGSNLPANLEPLYNFIVLQSGLETQNMNQSAIHSEFTDLVHRLRIETLKEKRALAKKNITKAEAGGNENLIEEALKEFDTLTKEMHNI
jgi:DNA primase